MNVKNKDGLTADAVASACSHSELAELLAKLRNDQLKDTYIQQLIPDAAPLKRIKIKLFGHSGVGKTNLVQSMSAGFIGSFFRRRESSSSSKDDHAAATAENGVSPRRTPGKLELPAGANYTRGIDVHQMNVPGVGELSVWEFSGYQAYHQIYDHFVGNTDCVHLVLFRLTDPPEIQYRQALYWMNFLQGRIMPTEPIGHCGVSAKRAFVVFVGTHADAMQQMLSRNSDGDLQCSELDAMLKTLQHRFRADFDILERPVLLDSLQPNSAGIKLLKTYLANTKNRILQCLPRNTGFFDECVSYLSSVRKSLAAFPVVPWPRFIDIVRRNVNPLAGEVHCRQLIQQLQLTGEVVYLKGDVQELDYVVLNAAWLCHDVIGNLLSTEFAYQHAQPSFVLDEFAQSFSPAALASPGGDAVSMSGGESAPKLLEILDALCLCAQYESTSDENDDGEIRFEFPAFFEPAESRPGSYSGGTTGAVWEPMHGYVYGGLRFRPPHGMDRMMGVMWPRVQVQLRRSMQEFHDPLDAELRQTAAYSKLRSGSMEALLSVYQDDQAIEIRVRAPTEFNVSCFYFLEDLANICEQVVLEVAPGMALERHFLSPRDLAAHLPQPLAYSPKAIMEMQLSERFTLRPPPGGGRLSNCSSATTSPYYAQQSRADATAEDADWETFFDVVCFGARDIALLLTLGVDLPMSQLPLFGRRELARMLDEADSLGRDWCLLALKLGLSEQLPEVDSSAEQLSKTDQCLFEWTAQSPNATIGDLCRKLMAIERLDALDAVSLAVPLYQFTPVGGGAVEGADDVNAMPTVGVVGSSTRQTLTAALLGGAAASSGNMNNNGSNLGAGCSCGDDSGIVSAASNSHSNSATSQRSSSTLSR